MRKTVLAMLAVTPLLSLSAPGHAAQGGTGFSCSAWQTSVGYLLFGGPRLVTDVPGQAHSGSMTCALHVGYENHTHAGVESVSVSGPTTPHVVLLVPTVVPFRPPDDRDLFLCTTVTTDEGTWYWNDSYDASVDGSWSTDPATANCEWQISAS